MSNWKDEDGYMLCNTDNHPLRLNGAAPGLILNTKGGKINNNMICPNSWIGNTTDIKNVNLQNSIITTSNINIGVIRESDIRSISINNLYCYNVKIARFRDIFTWFDKDHVIFKITDDSGLIYFRPDNHKIRCCNIRIPDLDINPGTYIARFLHLKQDLHLIWNCNEKKYCSENISYMDFQK